MDLGGSKFKGLINVASVFEFGVLDVIRSSTGAVDEILGVLTLGDAWLMQANFVAL